DVANAVAVVVAVDDGGLVVVDDGQCCVAGFVGNTCSRGCAVFRRVKGMLRMRLRSQLRSMTVVLWWSTTVNAVQRVSLEIPVQDVADSCRTGAAINVIFGLALGYQSVIIPIFAIAVSIFVSFSFSAMCIVVAALGMLSTIATGLAIDAYGPISDNDGGIVEMAGMSHRIHERTDALDAAGNTTAAIGKDFAIGSTALVSLALFGLLIGAMLPYWFSAMTLKSVGSAALKMVEEVRR
ncbi:Pyrophosphate-energized vacuolar membrane proton pump 1, partial [Bienertia sinuspersici]